MEILKRPLITEKLAPKHEEGRYGFFVALRANKLMIREAVEKAYGVTVVDVNTMRVAGKVVQRYTKRRSMKGRRIHMKKAIVLLKKGDSIDFYNEA